MSSACHECVWVVCARHNETGKTVVKRRQTSRKCVRPDVCKPAFHLRFSAAAVFSTRKKFLARDCSYNVDHLRVQSRRQSLLRVKIHQRVCCPGLLKSTDFRDSTIADNLDVAFYIRRHLIVLVAIRGDEGCTAAPSSPLSHFGHRFPPEPPLHVEYAPRLFVDVKLIPKIIGTRPYFSSTCCL